MLGCSWWLVIGFIGWFGLGLSWYFCVAADLCLGFDCVCGFIAWFAEGSLVVVNWLCCFEIGEDWFCCLFVWVGVLFALT